MKRAQSVRRTLEAHDTGPIRTGQGTLREEVVEGTRRDNYTAHHTASHTHTSTATHHTSGSLLLHHRGDANVQGQEQLVRMRTCRTDAGIEA